MNLSYLEYVNYNNASIKNHGNSVKSQLNWKTMDLPDLLSDFILE